jgi:hypothetical protein
MIKKLERRLKNGSTLSITRDEKTVEDVWRNEL